MKRELLQGLRSSSAKVYRFPGTEAHPAAHMRCRGPLSLCAAFVCARIEAAAFAHALPKPFAFLRRHVLPAFGKTIGHTVRHTAPVVRLSAAAAHSESAEENPAEYQQGECLPDADHGQ